MTAQPEPAAFPLPATALESALPARAGAPEWAAGLRTPRRHRAARTRLSAAGRYQSRARSREDPGQGSRRPREAHAPAVVSEMGEPHDDRVALGRQAQGRGA